MCVSRSFEWRVVFENQPQLVAFLVYRSKQFDDLDEPWCFSSKPGVEVVDPRIIFASRDLDMHRSTSFASGKKSLCPCVGAAARTVSS